MKSYWLVPVLSVSLVGCGKSEYVPQKPKVEVSTVDLTTLKPEQLMPLKEGNSWTYELSVVRAEADKPEVQGTAELTYTVKGVSNPSNGVTRATLAVTENGNPKDNQVWETDANGVYQLSVGSNPITFTPRQQIVKFPLKPDEKYKYEGTGVSPLGGSGKLSYEFAMHEMQPVDTDSGSLNGFFVESSGTFKGERGEGVVGNNSWFVPDVGLARFKQVIKDAKSSTAITLRLKSYNIKK